MKRLFYLIIIICLPLIAFFQYRQYQRWHPPVDYTYQISDAIDTEYHDPTVVERYYQAGQKAATIARHAWAEHRIDVKAADAAALEAGSWVKQYQQSIATAMMLEDRLERSKRLKDVGYTQDFIQQIEQQGWTDQEAQVQALLQNPVMAAFGDENDLVYSVQQMLTQLGYEMPIDGNFRIETQRGLTTFQEAQNLRPTGQLDRRTLLQLIETAEKNPAPTE